MKLILGIICAIIFAMIAFSLVGILGFGGGWIAYLVAIIFAFIGYSTGQTIGNKLKR